MALLFHYTNREGYNAIRSQPVWRFLASQPPGGRPAGAYFTSITPDRRQELCEKLFIPLEKTEFCFAFADAGDLRRLRGGRGKYVLYREGDYQVQEDRQQFHGLTADWVAPGEGGTG